MCAWSPRWIPRRPYNKSYHRFRSASYRFGLQAVRPMQTGTRFAGPCSMSSAARLKMAVIGQGHFAQAAVLPAIVQLPDVELSALVSGSDHKLHELGEHYHVRRLAHYDELDDLLASREIDAVYVAVPNDMHAEMTLIAARHGVHVLCEQPMAPTDVECMQMIRACAQRRVKLMIGYRLHFQAANLVAVEVARGGELGDLRIFS